MRFGEAIQSGFANYACFDGRASRSEYWFWTLFQTLVLSFGSMLDHFLLHSSSHFGILKSIGELVFLLPNLSVFVRRMHDTDRSGWWYWLVLTVIGVIPILIWLCRRGTEGPNRFGGDPLGKTEPQAIWRTW